MDIDGTYISYGGIVAVSLYCVSIVHVRPCACVYEINGVYVFFVEYNCACAQLNFSTWM